MAGACLLSGVLVGAVGGAFRWCLLRVEHQRDLLVTWAHGQPVVGWLAPIVVCGIAVGLARLLVLRFAPEAAGSGIQRVEAIAAHEEEPGTWRILPVKFFGGLLSLGAGMALGREGPTVQMGASIAHDIAPRLVQSKEDQRIVMAAGSGAGLAVAFNAPIGGSVFVFEELVGSVNPWLLLSTLGAATMAVAIMRLILGDQFDFSVVPGTVPRERAVLLFLLMGALLGIVGAYYNRVYMGMLRLAGNLTQVSPIARAGIIGGVIGLIAWFSPSLAGGGDVLTQSILRNKLPLLTVAGVFAIRFFMGPLSYSAETPGGMFSPMLLAGSAFGAVFGGVVHYFSLVPSVTVIDFAVVGMAALFAASVRAPITGMALAIEMTGRSDLTLGMLAAAFGAMLLAMFMKSEPIYDSLKERMLEQEKVRLHAAVGRSVGSSG